MRTTHKIKIALSTLAGLALMSGAANATFCSPPGAVISCTLSSGVTTCIPATNTVEFVLLDLLSAAQACDVTIDNSTPLVVVAAGGEGGNGYAFWPLTGGEGGKGGQAIMGATIADLENTYPNNTSFCFGIGGTGHHGSNTNGSGGASTILRTCSNVSQAETTGVLLIAGGGGGGEVSTNADGHNAGKGGTAVSATTGPCPPDCLSGSSPDGIGTNGNDSFDGGGDGAKNGIGAFSYAGHGNDGIGGVGGSTGSSGAIFDTGNPMVVGSTGQGGSTNVSGSGGGGGGGYGGGGSGSDGGGGGGGSFAAQSSISFSPPLGDNGGEGYLIFIFNHPDS